MACPAVTSGNGFLVSTLSHVDCQAQTLGSYGFQALAAPGSPAAIVLTALLALFVAIYGIRLLFGPVDEPRDLAGAILKIGIVLTLAVSWPAFRTLAYDTVLRGPAEVANVIMPATTLPAAAGLPQRLQGIDSGIAALTAAGTGRQTGEVIDEGAMSGFRPIALDDETGLGWSRTLFLAATIGPLAAVRLAGGLLLALAPLMAGLLLFELTRGLFAGWLRGLALAALGSLGLAVLYSVQVALMEPWLQQVLDRRALGYAVPAAPTELLALVLAFAIAATGLMALLAKVAFQNAWAFNRQIPARLAPAVANRRPQLDAPAGAAAIPVYSRAAALSETMALTVRREERQGGAIDPARRIGSDRPGDLPPGAAGGSPHPVAPLGSGYRRTARRDTVSGQLRDRRG